MKRDLRTTTQQGLGAEHQRRRRELLPHAIGRPCPLCGETMRADQRLHLDHSVPRSVGGRHGDRIVHGWCNESRGNGQRRPRRARGGRHAAPPPTSWTSREW